MLYLLELKPLKIYKKCFFFTLKALFILKIFKCLYWIFGHVEKNGLVNEMNSFSVKLTNATCCEIFLEK